jgi:hypothetical protein
VLRNVVVPYLTELGERWAQRTASGAQEHFASNVIHGRLAGLARGWGSGRGRSAILASPGELRRRTGSSYTTSPRSRSRDTDRGRKIPSPWALPDPA